MCVVIVFVCSLCKVKGEGFVGYPFCYAYGCVKEKTGLTIRLIVLIITSAGWRSG